MPVVKVVQLEDTVDLPPELNLPWPYLQRYFGFAADSGNHTSNVLLNFNEDGVRAFTFDSTLPMDIQSTEEAFFKLLYDIETMSLRKIDIILSRALNLFHVQMREAHISRRYWLIRFNGVSGNQIVLIQVPDAFLDIEPYLSDEDMTLYIPLQQRLFSQTGRKQSIRQQLGSADAEIAEEFENIAKKLRSYRAAHRSRAMPHLRQPAPERFHMTAGKSVLTTDVNLEIAEAIAPLEEMLIARLKVTT
ncbi:hypothetical protein F5Y09DRAFT_349615 [Xylaria sp. FL1042]|nr:hypothetical protein F5Y09DRAFT_349615 [Xylaria sp. FL1042]